MKRTMKFAALFFVFSAVAHSQFSAPAIVNVTVAPSGSCVAGLPDQQVVSTGVIYTCQGGTWGALATGSSGNAITVNGASVPANAQILASNSSSQLVSLSPSTDDQMLTLDLNRTDSYTEDGTIERPYKTLPTLVAGFPSSGLVSVFSSPNASYTASSAATLPALPTTIYGNNSTWTVTGGLILTAKTISYDLTDGAAVTYNYASTDRSEKHGGAFLGNVNVAQGYLHAFGTNLSGNSNTFTVGGASTAALLYGEALTGSQQVASGGAGALIALYNPNMTKSSGYNITMANGGQLLFSGGLLSTVAGTANIYLPTANTVATAHVISGLITGTGSGVNCVNGTTTYVVYGFNLANITNCTLVPGYQGPTQFLGPITSNGTITAPAGTPLVIKTSGPSDSLTLDSYGNGDVNLGTGNAIKLIYIGTGSQIKTVTIGNATSSSKVNIYGEIDGVAAASGMIGQELTPVCIPRGSGTALTSASTINFLTLSLPTGDWDVWGNVNLVGAALTATNGNFANSITTTSATVNTDGSEVLAPTLTMTTWTGYNSVVLPSKHVPVSTTTPVYLVVNFQGTITSGTGTLWGCIAARRVH